MKTAELMDLAKAGLGVTSDYALSKALNVSRQVVSDWRAGRKWPTLLLVYEMAGHAGLDAGLVTAEIELERAEVAGNDDQVTAWKQWVQRFGGYAAAMLIGAAITGPSPNANAATARPAADLAGDRLCIMSTRKRRSALQRMRDFLTFPPLQMA